MLRPQDTPTRETKILDGLWAFRLDRDGVGDGQGWFRGPLPEAGKMAVPASFNDLMTDAADREFHGDIWYQRSVRIPRGWDAERISLYVSSATHRARVWVDGTYLGSHEGGYLPFELDLGETARPGAEVLVTICVNNTLTFQSIPPGVTEDGVQRYFHDFFNYAGLHRSVLLTATPRERIEDITVVTDIDGPDGLVRASVEAAGEGPLRAVLRDVEGAEVARENGRELELRVPAAHLWAPGDGYLYELTLQLLAPGSDAADDRAAVVDEYRQDVGIRTVEVRGTEFLINGEPFAFTGFGMHEDHAIVGKQHNDALMLRDRAMIDWIGANSVRTSHYPYSEEFMDHADRTGLVVIDETPAVGLNMGLGGGIFGSQGYTTFSPETCNDETQANHAQVIRDLVARDKNRPSVVLWSIANEPESET